MSSSGAGVCAGCTQTDWQHSSCVKGFVAGGVGAGSFSLTSDAFVAAASAAALSAAATAWSEESERASKREADRERGYRDAREREREV